MHFNDEFLFIWINVEIKFVDRLPVANRQKRIKCRCENDIDECLPKLSPAIDGSRTAKCVLLRSSLSQRDERDETNQIEEKKAKPNTSDPITRRPAKWNILFSTEHICVFYFRPLLWSSLSEIKTPTSTWFDGSNLIIWLWQHQRHRRRRRHRRRHRTALRPRLARSICWNRKSEREKIGKPEKNPQQKSSRKMYGTK